MSFLTTAERFFQNIGLGPIALIVIAAGLITIIGRVRRTAVRLILLLLSFIVDAFGLLAVVLWKPFASIVRRLFPKVPARISRALLRWGYRKGDLLCSGRREQAARVWWSESMFPFLYRPVPADILRPLHEDGKLVGGVSMTWLADRHMTERAITSAVLAGMVFGLFLLIPALLNFILAILHVVQVLSYDISTHRPVLEQWPDDAPVLVPWSWWASSVASSLALIAPTLLLITLAVWIPWLLIALAGSIIGFLGALKAWMWEKELPYTLITKDADVRWGSRIEARNLSNAVYRKQIELSEGYLKDTPLFKLGVGTGVSRMRGDLAAPQRGQAMCLDRDSLFQHLLVFGGTGEGKTTAILKPLMRQLMGDRTRGFYVCDAKGVLWRDALSVATACGREKDVLIIGTGEGQFGVDPLANLTPTQVAATLRSVLRQASGGASDNFWPEMAANILRHVLTLALTYKLTQEGQEEAARTRVEPYSLWWAYQAVLDKEKLARVIVCIREFDQSLKEEFDKFLETASSDEEVAEEARRWDAKVPPEAQASIHYIDTTWTSMAEETKSGIVANVSQLLDGFAGARSLRERFASGQVDEKTIGLADALDGRIVLNALSSIEDGLPARLVLILLKTSLYREARRREVAFKTSTPRRNPQDLPCIVMIDEVQEIATADPDSGLSDATFWNVARSTGLAGIFATQTLAALDQALGKEAAANFVQQARSKVFFRSEEPETVGYACWCAGEFERNRVFEDGQRESIEHRELMDGWNPFVPIDETESVRSGSHLFRSAAANLRSPTGSMIQQAVRRNVYEPDFRYVNSLPGDKPGENSILVTAIQMRQAAAWRAEDLDRDYRTQGNENRQALTPSDMLGMGRWHAFAHIQRAGAARQDIITVEHDYG